MRPTNWSCFRRIGDDREARAYGGGWEVFRGGIAKCMVEVDKGLAGDVRSSEPKARRPLEPSERTSTGRCQLKDEALQGHKVITWRRRWR